MTNNENLKQPVATVMGSYGYGWQQMWKYFLHFFLLLILLTLVSAPISMIQDYNEPFSAGNVMLQIFAAGYLFMIVPIFDFGADLLYLRGIRNEKIDLGEILAGFRENYLNIVLANLLVFAIVGIGFVFLIVPGIILACRLSFVPLLVMDKKMDAVAAVEKSWTMTRGYGWKIFGLFLMAIPVFFAGLICFIVGALFAVIWISASFTSLYHAIDLKHSEDLDDDSVNVEIAS